MKILFFTRLYYPHIGGVEKHIYEISKVLIKDGHKITVLTTRHEDNLLSDKKMGGIRIVRFFQPAIKYFGLLYTWYFLFKNRSLIKESDVVHIHDVFIWYWPFKILFPKKRVYVTNHGQWGNFPISISDIIQKKISRLFASGIISVGKYIDKNYHIKSDSLIYGAVNIVNNAGRSKDKKLLLYVGRLDKSISLAKFLEVLEILKTNNLAKNLKVEFCGDGELRSRCEQFGVVHGFSDPSKYYEKATYVYASGYLTILEAIMNKCLVFTMYCNPHQKDYYRLSPFSKYIVTENSSKKLASVFMGFQSNPRIGTKIRKEGYNFAKKYSWENLVNVYTNLWKK
jgi:glycosyltransferase involved in cell wall biosynthesis